MLKYDDKNLSVCSVVFLNKTLLQDVCPNNWRVTADFYYPVMD